MANRYWVGNGGNWSDNTNHWSASSGGAAGASLPTSSDNVFFNASSFSSASQTVVIDTAADCADMDWMNVTNTPTLQMSASKSLNIYGNLTFVAGMAISNNSISTATSFVNFKSTSTGKTITMAGQTWPSSWSSTQGTIRFIGVGGGWTLQDAFSTGTVNATIEIIAGALNTNGQTVTTRNFNMYFFGSGTRSVTLGASTVNVLGWDYDGGTADATNLTFDAGTSTINMGAGDSFSFNGMGLTYNDVSINAAKNPTLKGGGTFNTLTITDSTQTSTITIEAGTSWTATTLNINGISVTNKMTIRSSVTGTQYTIGTQAQYESDVYYLDIQDANASNNVWYAHSSLDSGNNNHIIFRSTSDDIAVETTRKVASSLQVSWKKDFRPDITFFTIGVSLIGGNDIIAPTEQIDSQWNKYIYSDESDYVLGLEWEQGLKMPTGGLSQGLAAGELDNTTGRYLPRYMGGNSELFTAILPRRPFIINAGFEDTGIDYLEPQFVGLFTRQPQVDIRNRTMKFNGADFTNFLQNRYVDNTVMYTGYFSDQLIEVILQDLGYATAQYELDYGINQIPFAIFNKGDRFGEIIDRIVESENGQFYQDEQGTLRFENRQHWDSSPHTEVQYAIYTSQVIDAEAPNDDHIINVVEVNADIREKQPSQVIYKLATLASLLIEAGDTVTQFFAFEDPVLALTNPTSGGSDSYFLANSAEDGSGTDLTSSITFTNRGTFAENVKYDITNSGTTNAYITELVISGRVAKQTKNLYYRSKNDSSVTAFEERPLRIDNPYIHEISWAQSYAQMILNDFAQPENLQQITILAIPKLKLGDLISWQGRHWRVFNKKTRLDPDYGFVQELMLLQRTVISYFRIGISTIGGTDLIAP